MRLIDLIGPRENIGPAPKSVCRSGKPDSDLPASWLASCRSQGLRRRDSDKKHTIKGKRISIDGKRIKGRQYGSAGSTTPDYSD
jgi:hypothetical protein